MTRLALLVLLAATEALAQSAVPPETAGGPSACAEPVVLPAPSGPRGVGAATYHWTDPARPEPRAPGAAREFMATVFYPADAGSRPPRPYVPELAALRAALRAGDGDGPRGLGRYASQFACVHAAAVADAPLDDAGAPYPLVLVSPGGDMSRHWYTALAQDLASHGYVVAVLSHAHSGLDVFPLAGLVGKSPYYDEGDPALDDALTDRLAEDARFVLDRLVALGRGGPRFAGALDPDRVAIVGHSRGSRAVRRGCARGARFRACVVYDALGPAPERAAGLDVPELTVRAPWAETWGAARVDTLRAALARNRAVAFDAVVAGAGHFSFSDLALVVPERFGADVPARRALALTAALTRTFLRAVLSGGAPSETAALPPPDPGVTVTRFGPAPH